VYLIVVNALAALFVFAGFHLAFRQKTVLGLSARVRSSFDRSRREPHLEASDSEGVASVLRLAGVMMMAFSFTAAAFADLIAYYTAADIG
jgi:hypothetical protein